MSIYTSNSNATMRCGQRGCRATVDTKIAKGGTTPAYDAIERLKKQARKTGWDDNKGDWYCREHK